MIQHQRESNRFNTPHPKHFKQKLKTFVAVSTFFILSILPLKEALAKPQNAPVKEIPEGYFASADVNGMNDKCIFRLISNKENLDTIPESQLYANLLKGDPNSGFVMSAQMYRFLGAWYEFEAKTPRFNEMVIHCIREPFVPLSLLYFDDFNTYKLMDNTNTTLYSQSARRAIVYNVSSTTVYDTSSKVEFDTKYPHLFGTEKVVTSHTVNLDQVHVSDIYVDEKGQLREKKIAKTADNDQNSPDTVVIIAAIIGGLAMLAGMIGLGGGSGSSSGSGYSSSGSGRSYTPPAQYPPYGGPYYGGGQGGNLPGQIRDPPVS